MDEKPNVSAYLIVEVDGDGMARPCMAAIPISDWLANFVERMPTNAVMANPHWLRILWLMNGDDGYPPFDLNGEPAKIVLAKDISRVNVIPTPACRCSLYKKQIVGSKEAYATEVYFNWMDDGQGVGWSKTIRGLVTADVVDMAGMAIILVQNGIFRGVIKGAERVIVVES